MSDPIILSNSSKTLTNTNLTLKTLPLEVRLQIWERLLVNPEVADRSCISSATSDGRTARYNLTPAILRVCKQFLDEAKGILYGSNKFIIECSFYCRRKIHKATEPYMGLCAITRYFQIPPFLEDEFASSIETLKLVKHRKVVLGTSQKRPIPPHNRFIAFCQTICSGQIRSLEIVIRPRQWQANWNNHYPIHSASIFAPLKLLRNVQRIEIRQATCEEIPDGFDPLVKPSKKLVTILPQRSVMLAMASLIQGNSEIERFHDIYNVLLVYASTFLRLDDFKGCMNSISKYHSRLNPHPHSYDNPFRVDDPSLNTWHIVEFNIDAASQMLDNAHDLKNVEALKKIRTTITKYLEPQYQRIQMASDNLVGFVKSQKSIGGIFDPKPETPRTFESADANYAEALLLLEEYAASFTRDVDQATKLRIYMQREQYNARFQSLPREVALKICFMFYKVDCEEFIKYYKIAVEDMDSQYLQMREARKNIFKWDLKSDRLPEIDVQPLRCDERIDWESYEPEICVEKSAEMLRLETGKSKSLSRNLV